jgi:hypothetical protein
MLRHHRQALRRRWRLDARHPPYPNGRHLPCTLGSEKTNRLKQEQDGRYEN